MTVYRAKPDTWFKEDTVAELIESVYTSEGREFGIFRGTYIVGSCNPLGYDKFWYKQEHKDGDEVIMNELCAFDEFKTEII